MTRNEIINEMHKKAIEVIKNWTRDGENELWSMALNWNREHEDEEIFMCEYTMDKNGNDAEEVTGFMIEDDFYLYMN